MITEWFIKRRTALLHEPLSIEGQGPLALESLAQAIKRLSEQGPDIDSDYEAHTRWHEAIFEYRQRHSLRFALRGADIDDIIVGNNHGHGEISLENDRQSWRYHFNISDLCHGIEQELRNCLKSWATTDKNAAARARAHGLLQLLNTGSENTEL